MWDEQARAKGVDNHEKDQISFWDALGKPACAKVQKFSTRGPISLKQGFSEKVLCQRKLQTQPEETWTVRASGASQKGRAESLMSKEERDNM